ncbi:MAG: 3-deoxy-7-phosphoheptulonate synthase [Chromatiales bacterium]|jgi:3-deoxy-7-phosphoheptulonate synthase|nr:3-deoxy-7-phosphoheptulonate synthase [Chromatiales bacterium]
MNTSTEDLRIASISEVSTPQELHGEVPMTASAATCVRNTRDAIHAILTGQDERLLVIVGPCSIHDPQAAREYAAGLSEQKAALADDLLIVMRVYFEKPRTTVGWKGLINDPYLDGSFKINEGLRVARRLLVDLNSSGMPAGVEFLDLLTPQYIADLVSWGAIGARTTESQLHRELASGLSCPVGFKNGTDGNVKIAVDALRAARGEHNFLSLTQDGRSAIFTTSGNEDCHVILRGGTHPNYDPSSIDTAVAMVEAAKLRPNVMVDLSHANSAKRHQRQVTVGRDLADQMSEGNRNIMGVMIESHLVAGRQDVKSDQPLTYGQSITDACIGWDDTVSLLRVLAEASATRRSNG